MKVQLKLKKRKSKDGLHPIYVVVSQGRDKRKFIKTPVRIKEEHWNERTCEIRRSHSNKQELDEELNNAAKEVQKKINSFEEQNEEMDWHDFLEFLNGGKQLAEPKHKPFWDAYHEHTDIMKTKVTNDSYKDLLSLNKHLISYEKSRKVKLSWQKMTFMFYEDFVAFLEHEQVKPNGEIGLAVNTVGKQVKNVKAFLKKSAQRGYCDYIPLDGWKVYQQRGEHVYLTNEELQQIWSADLSDNKEMEVARDLFIVGAETGLRVSDFTADLTHAIDGNLIRYKTQKTENEVIIPISPLLREVMDKYNGSIPHLKKYRFNKLIKPIMRRCGIKTMVQKRSRKRGEKVSEYFEKWRLVSSHTCRRSFCTNMYLKGVPVPVIMQVSGHTTQKAFMRYVQVTNQEVAEELLREWKW